MIKKYFKIYMYYINEILKELFFFLVKIFGRWLILIEYGLLFTN